VFNEKFDLPNVFAASFNPLCVGNPGPAKLSGTRKVIQLTGNLDREMLIVYMIEMIESMHMYQYYLHI
jgi:hypothetical protein